MTRWNIWAAVAIAVSIFFTRWGLFPTFNYRAPIDLQVYVQGGLLALRGEDLYAQGVPVDIGSLPFTYPPFASLVFATFAWLPFPVILCGYYAATIACAVAVSRWIGLPGAFAVAFLCTQPGFSSMSFGQVNIFLMTLVVADALGKRPRWLPAGFLIGIAAAIKVTPAIFLLWYLVRRDVRGFLGVLAGGAFSTLLAAVLMPGNTWTYFTRALIDPNRVGDPSYIHNASLTGVLARMNVGGLATFAVVLALALGAWAAYRAARAEHDLLALVIVAGVGLLISPISWTHHFVWLPVLAVAAVRAGMNRGIAWWAGVAGTVGLALTVIKGPIAEIAVAQYALVVLSVIIWAATKQLNSERSSGKPS